MIEEGDVVRVKSGGVWLTVASIDANDAGDLIATCLYASGYDLAGRSTVKYPVAVLERRRGWRAPLQEENLPATLAVALLLLLAILLVMLG